METSAPVYQVVPLADLRESEHNPRTHYDPAAIAELADSIKARGVLTPLLVRPLGVGYEIAAGHRARARPSSSSSNASGWSQLSIGLRFG